MLAPQARLSRNRKAGSVSFPAPVGGWNARDPLSLMAPTDAVTLDNYLPRANHVELRKGYASHVTGLGAEIRTLFWHDDGVNSELKAATATDIYDVTTSGAVGAAEVSSLTSGNWQVCMFKGRSFWVNGNDAPRDYDGTTWSSTAWSGTSLTITDLVNVCAHKSRLYFAESGTASFWYATAGAITGTLTEFDLGQLAPRGGTITALGSWSRDGGSGPDDYFVAVFSNGDVVVYSGSDPSSSTDWALVGRFSIGRPLGRRCLVNYGPDLLVLTEDGYVNLSQMLPADRTAPALALSDKIRGAVIDAATGRVDSFGWQALVYYPGAFLLVNVPTASGYEQHAMDLTTQQWCRLTGMAAVCWSAKGGDLFFGDASGTVWQAWTGTGDNSTDISGDIRCAFSDFGDPGRLKRFTLARPVLGSDADLPVAIGFDVDYNLTYATYTPSTVTGSGATWDTATWDVDYWAQAMQTTAEWRTINGIGYSGSLLVRTQTQYQQVRVYRFDYQFEAGDGL